MSIDKHGSVKTREERLSAAQKAAVEKIKILMREYAFVTRPSFLYTKQELMRSIETELSRLDEEYVNRYKIPANLVKKFAREVYDALMEKGEYDRAITVADHYKL